MSSVANLDLHVHKKSYHRRNNSGELDVFEAANYFSSETNNDENHRSLDTLKFSKETSSSTACSKQQMWKQSAGARLSLDIPTRKTDSRMPESTQHSHLVQSEVIKERMVKNKQPSSPGGRLASFLNSLFAASTKKKTKSSQDDQRPRMRRSSISHVDSKSVYSAPSTAAGFRTPPPYARTQNYKSFGDSKSCLDHKQVILTLPKQATEIKNGVTLIKTSLEVPSSDKIRRKSESGLVEKEMIFNKVDRAKEFEFRKVDVAKDFEHDDDGAESDTSSDLFELQTYDLGDFSSSELPVYETTNVDQIKKSPKLVSK